MEVFSKITNYPNYAISNTGKVINIHSGIELKQMLSRGHCIVNLYNKYGKKQYYIHRIMAQHFLENINNFKFVDHIDTNPLNNVLSNLRWASISMNVRNTKKRNRGNITKIQLKYGDFSWRVCVGLNGNRHRKTFSSEKEAINYLNQFIKINDVDILHNVVDK